VTSLVMIACFLVLLLAGVEVATSMGLAAFLGLGLLGLPLVTFARYVTEDVRAVTLLAVPFFILTGNLMNHLNLARRIFDFINALLGSVRGGLAQANIVASIIFGGISGSALADIVGLGSMAIAAMTRAGYRAEFSAALTVASSLLTPLLPPSVAFILYAVLANVSVGQMFAAGLLPGLILAAILLANNLLLARVRLEEFPAPVPLSGRALGRAAWRGLPALLAPVVILRSMVTGLVTPTEASILAVLYALLLGVLHQEISIPRLLEAMRETIRTTATVMYLTGIGTVMGFVLTSDQLADRLAAQISAWTDSRWLVLSLVSAALLLLGCFLETVPAILIGVPLFEPLVAHFGIDPLQFGVVMVFALLFGVIHPPVGLGLFAVCAVTGLKLENVVRASLLFYPALFLALLLFMFIPALSTWLPSVLFVN
jgi:tripartite ATP-independent transporter DctM subunit